MSYCIIMTTFESKEQARPVVDALIQKKLAACIQHIEVQSSYIWNDEVQNDPEVLVLIKTRDDLYDEVRKILEQIHPYDTPEIIKVPITDGSKGYLSWIDSVTK